MMPVLPSYRWLYPIIFLDIKLEKLYNVTDNAVMFFSENIPGKEAIYEK